LHLSSNTAPFFCAVFPLVKNKPEVTAKAEQVYLLLKKIFPSLYDEAASVGRRYARADEIGVRYCITIDFESLEDDAVTIRDRETTQQERVKISQLVQRLSEKI
ncbi:MAG: His/Gly/Thr/Pro-type tRNA ligase C-terminal domain-containing protein, partial [Nanoarchaeota archaeon]